MQEALEHLKNSITGDLYSDLTMRTLYATDASVYKEMPLAVARPKTIEDIKNIIAFATKYKTSIIPRTAGTSLAGQVVGAGMVVDVSKYWTKILEVNQEEKWVRVQPGVNLDELNKYLESYNLFFGPETSTSNRCMMGGMVGNNSCGSHSVIYGTTRDHTLEMKVILADGNETTFKAMTQDEFMDKCIGKSAVSPLEEHIYQHIKETLTNKTNVENILKEFPKPTIKRRNTGYAIDELLDTELFINEPYLTYKQNGIGIQNRQFNFCKLLAGSEGTLCFTTEIKLNLVPIPPAIKGALAVHLYSIDQACKATVIALKYNPGAVELLDDIILNVAKRNIEQQKNLFFVQGNPKAIIVIEWARDTQQEIQLLANELQSELLAAGLGYHFHTLWGAEISAAWSLRKAGLGLLANIPGDAKAVACIEDTSVDVNDQAEYAAEFGTIMAKYDKNSVYYAHIGDGELHLRPILDLKLETDRSLFYKITDDVATLVKKYGGSLSGEHGDGRVRGEFIKKMVGEANFNLFLELKNTWDPDNIFNPGKIVNTPKMNDSMRYQSGQETKQFDTVFNFKETGGILRMAEKCNGSGDCRKSATIGGTMCPSYMATKNEKDTTRARANILRDFLTNSTKKNAFDHQEIKDVYDLCLSCKGCKNECPSNVDVATLKAEFLQQYYDTNGVPFRTYMIGNFVKNMQLASKIPKIYNFLMTNGFTSYFANKIMGIHPKRHFPLLHKTTFLRGFKKNFMQITNAATLPKKIYLFADEFTNFNDVEIGFTAVKLLNKLGYHVIIPTHHESGRTYLSKGMVREAQKLAILNVTLLKDVVSNQTPMVGIEPSCILTFRDEYPRLVPDYLENDAITLGKNCLMIDEFLAKELDNGAIKKSQFTTDTKKIKLHGHCHQKALASITPTKKLLEFPENYKVEMIPSGCCGMAGSFGYETNHYDVSMKVGELILFPAVRNAVEYEIAAPGTSCRHQIFDGTGRKAKHPVEILWEALV